MSATPLHDQCLSCECGSVHFHVRRDLSLECAKCGTVRTLSVIDLAIQFCEDVKLALTTDPAVVDTVWSPSGGPIGPTLYEAAEQTIESLRAHKKDEA